MIRVCMGRGGGVGKEFFLGPVEFEVTVGYKSGDRL